MKITLLKLTQQNANAESVVYINIQKIISIEDVRHIPLCDNYGVQTVITLDCGKEIGVTELIENIVTERMCLEIKLSNKEEQ